jgi:CHAT domain-containing protein
VGDVNYSAPAETGTSRGTSASGLRALGAGARYSAYRGKLQPLPYTAKESKWVTDAFKQEGIATGSLLQQNAREASVRTFGGNYEILHLACHGLVDQGHGNLFGALALTPGPSGAATPADDGYLTLQEIYAMNLHGTRLAILSACDTNYGPQQRGEGVWSLSRGFLVAGAQRVVASNWLVDDEAAATLITAFCTAVAKGQKAGDVNYATSLHQAKRYIREQEKWQAPYYWGTFVLVGPGK